MMITKNNTKSAEENSKGYMNQIVEDITKKYDYDLAIALAFHIIDLLTAEDIQLHIVNEIIDEVRTKDINSTKILTTYTADWEVDTLKHDRKIVAELLKPYDVESIEELIIKVRADEQAFVEKRCKELGIDYIPIFTCNSAE